MQMQTQTIIRTVVLAVAFINQILAVCGKETLPVYENDIVQIISLSATLASGVWAWWKNNSFTKEALRADKYLAQLRGKKAE